MKWQGRRQSTNVEDRRGMPGGRVALGGGATILVLVVAMLFGADPRLLLEQMQGLGTGQPVQEQGARDPQQDELAAFSATILADTEDIWKAEFERMGRDYLEPHLVLFTESVESACGLAGSAVGPFYCPADSKLYLDFSFFEVMDRQLGAPGDFAQAYVIAHEVGHHVQNQLGISERVSRMREQLSAAEANELSVRVELQADFFAGLWAHHSERMRPMLDPGDLEEALHAASAIGDDRLQRRSQGTIVPDSFTHGTSEQRVRWFRKGFETGEFSQGDTFRERTL